jgi:uncharacterized protein YjlB
MTMRRTESQAARAQARPPFGSGEYRVFRFEPNGWVPNNETLAVIVYRRVLPADDRDTAAEAFEERFGQNGWPPQWRDSVFDYHHYHSTAHEVMGVLGGSADLILGGPSGYTLRVAAGDALLLPAGTGHCLLEARGGFQVVGAYPQGQQWDLRRDALTPDEQRRMLALPFPPNDPVYGANGPMVETWR